MKNVLKKFTTALITLTMCIGTAGCTTKKAAETTNVEKVIGAQKLTNLGQNEVLVIGDDQFKNIEYSEEKYSYLTYTNAIEYNLVRTSYSSSSYVSYGSYYYYWEISKHNDELLLGKQTDTYIVTYEYLVYENSETILVKTKQEKSVSYNYNGGWKSIEPEYTFIGNGPYFEDLSNMDRIYKKSE